jgi:hypothetical protein
MKFPSLFRLSAWLCFLSTAAVWAAASEAPLWLGAFVVLTGVGEAFRRRGRFRALRFTREGALPLGGLAVAGIVLLPIHDSPIRALGNTCLLLLAARFQGARLPLHYIQGAAGALLLFVTACFLPSSFLFFPALVYFVFFTVFFLILLDSFTRRFFFLLLARRGQMDGGSLTVQVDEPLGRTDVLRRLGLFTAGAGVHVLLMAALIFILAPRFGSQRPPDAETEKETAVKKEPSRTGSPSADTLLEKLHSGPEGGKIHFRDRVSLNRDRRGEGSDRRLLAARFFRGSRPIPPPSLGLYFKGATLDRFDGKTWTRSTGREREVRDARDGLMDNRVFLGRGLPEWDACLRIEIWTKTDLGQRRFWMDELDGVSGRMAQVDIAGDLRGSNPVFDAGHAYTYSVYVRPTLVTPFGRGDDKEKYLRLYKGADRLSRMARMLSRGTGKPLSRARALSRKLQKSYTYAKDFDTGGSKPLEDFLYRTRTGNCEYFSTALTLLLRALGVPARLVVGFYGGAYGHDGDEVYLVIRESNAHAWTEVLDEDEGGWVRVDATPILCRPGAAEQETDDLFSDVTAPLPPPEGPRTLLGRIEVYDSDLQKDLLAGSARALGRAASAAGGFLGSLFTDYFLITISVLALLAIAFVLKFTRPKFLGGRRKAPEGFEDAQRDSTYSFYVAFLKALSRLGFNRRIAMTPLEFARKVSAARSSVTQDVTFVTAAFNRARYGGMPPDKKEMARIRQVVKSLQGAEKTEGEGAPSGKART